MRRTSEDMQIISRFEKDNNALITSVESLSKQLLKIFRIPFEILSSHCVVANPTAHQIMGSSLNDSLGNQNIGRPRNRGRRLRNQNHQRQLLRTHLVIHLNPCSLVDPLVDQTNTPPTPVSEAVPQSTTLRKEMKTLLSLVMQ